MLVVAIETSTNHVSCALGNEATVLAAFELSRDRKHAEALIPSIDFLLRRVDAVPSDITHVATDVGPGLFTGLRVGVATAKGLAYSLGVPMCSVSSLEALANVAPYSKSHIYTLLDAKRGEVFYARYQRVNEQLVCQQGIRTASPSDFARDVNETRNNAVVIGHTSLVMDRLDGSVELLQHAAPSAASVLQIAQRMIANGEIVDADDLDIRYYRNSDAELNAENTKNTDKAESVADNAERFERP